MQLRTKPRTLKLLAQYQFDFGLRPAVSFLMSKGRDLHAAGGADNPAGVDDKDLVKYADVGATYYFNKTCPPMLTIKSTCWMKMTVSTLPTASLPMILSL